MRASVQSDDARAGEYDYKLSGECSVQVSDKRVMAGVLAQREYNEK